MNNTHTPTYEVLQAEKFNPRTYAFDDAFEVVCFTYDIETDLCACETIATYKTRAAAVAHAEELSV